MRRALADDAEAQAAQVTFRTPRIETEAELVHWRQDGGAAEGSLSEIALYYASLERGRLVILGQPGSGKTILAYHLAVKLTHHLLHRTESGGMQRAPVWASLPSWDLGDAEDLDKISDDQLVKMFDSWIVQRITAYGVSLPLAELLVQQDLILPILDGLDEMELGNRGRSSTNEMDKLARASAVVRVLNSFGRRPLVLTCREEQYRNLAQGNPTGRAPVVQDAQQVIIQPLEVGQVAAYIERRFPSGAVIGSSPWDEVVAALRADSDGPLAQVVRTPWRLFLVLTAYGGGRSDPREMIGQDYEGLSRQLMAQFIPATVVQFPRPRGGHYTKQEVTTWLSAIASQLASRGYGIFSSQVEIRVEEFWELGGFGAKVLARLSRLLVVGPYLWWAVTLQDWSFDSVWSWVYIILLVVGAVGMVVIVPSFEFSRFDPNKYRQGRVQMRMITRIVVGGLAGACYGLVFWLISWIFDRSMETTLTTNIAWSAIAGLLYGTWWASQAASSPAAALGRPSDVVRQGLQHDIILLLVLGGVVLMPVLLIMFSPWPTYAASTYLAHRRGLLPRRPAAFLDWAYNAGLLRLSGGAIQFRHRELQDWLTARISPYWRALRSLEIETD